MSILVDSIPGFSVVTLGWSLDVIGLFSLRVSKGTSAGPFVPFEISSNPDSFVGEISLFAAQNVTFFLVPHHDCRNTHIYIYIYINPITPHFFSPEVTVPATAAAARAWSGRRSQMPQPTFSAEFFDSCHFEL